MPLSQSMCLGKCRWQSGVFYSSSVWRLRAFHCIILMIHCGVMKCPIHLYWCQRLSSIGEIIHFSSFAPTVRWQCVFWIPGNHYRVMQITQSHLPNPTIQAIVHHTNYKSQQIRKYDILCTNIVRCTNIIMSAISIWINLSFGAAVAEMLTGGQILSPATNYEYMVSADGLKINSF